MFHRFFILILLIFNCLSLQAEHQNEELQLSAPEYVASLNGSSLIGRIISPLNGQPVLRETDLIIRGAQEIALTRHFIPLYTPCFFHKPEEHHKHHKKHHHHKHNEEEHEEHDKRSLFYYLMKHYKGWVVFPHFKLQFFPHHNLVRLCDPSGMTLDFHIPHSTEIPAPLASGTYGIHNTFGDIPD